MIKAKEFGDVFVKAMQPVLGVVKKIGTFIGDLAKKLGALLQPLIHFVTGNFKGAWESLKTGMFGGLTEPLKDIKSGSLNLMGGAFNTIKGAVTDGIITNSCSFVTPLKLPMVQMTKVFN